MRTFVDNLAGIGRHALSLRRTTSGTSDNGLFDHGTSLPRSDLAQDCFSVVSAAAMASRHGAVVVAVDDAAVLGRMVKTIINSDQRLK